jgi:hypothetical protein
MRETIDERLERIRALCARHPHPDITPPLESAADEAVRPLRAHDHDDWRRYDLARLRTAIAEIRCQIDPLTEAIGECCTRPPDLYDEGGACWRAYQCRARILGAAERAEHLLGMLGVGR